LGITQHVVMMEEVEVLNAVYRQTR
jgi:hypothetical protein